MEGNPINAATGNKFQAETDFVGGPTTGLELRRFYNSQDTTATVFGTGWRSAWQGSLKQVDATTIAVTRADGRVESFTKNASGAWVSDPDVTSRLSQTGSGWQLTAADDSVEAYAADGRLTSITTRAGQVTSLVYDTGNRLYKIVGPFGHTLTFGYDTSNRISRMTAPDGSLYRYDYNGNNNLTSVTYPDNTVRQYVYESPFFPNALTGIVDENGKRFATWTYNTAGKAVSSEHANGADKTTLVYHNDGTVSVTDPNGNQHGYTLMTQWGMVKPIAVTGAPIPNAGGAAFVYDPATGFIKSVTDFNGNVTQYMHDARGNETSRKEAAGTQQARTISTQWHPTLHVPTKITEPNRVTTLTLDARGNVTQKTITAGGTARTWKYTYNGVGQVLTIDGPRTDATDITSYRYNTNGTLAAITNALNQTTRITSYNANGRPLSFTDPNGLVTNLSYTPRGWLKTVDAGGEVTRNDYDPVGNLKKVTLPDGSFLTYDYDDAHRLKRVTDALGNHIDWTLDAAGNLKTEDVYDPSGALARTRSFVYDKVNRLQQMIGAQGQTTIYDRDPNGNVKKVTDPLSHTTSLLYDHLNRPIQRTDPAGVTKLGYNANDNTTSVTDPRKLVTNYAYNGLGDNSAVKSPDTGTTGKKFDNAGNLTSATAARGKTTRYDYDALNRLTKATFADNTFYAYGYDEGVNGVGRLTSMTDPSGTTRWDYDQHGRMVTERRTINGVTLATRHSYDTAGRLASMTYPSGKVISYSYDAAGQINSIALNGQMMLGPITYEPFGPVNSWVTKGDALYVREYDTDGRVKRIVLDGSGSPAGGEIVDYTYDPAGRITQQTQTGQPDRTYGYDASDRIVYYKAGSLVQSWKYDEPTGLGDGNRTQQKTAQGSSLITITSTYAAANNRLTQRTDGAATVVSTYDAAGNTLTDGAVSYLYGANGRLMKATSGGVDTNYLYNGLGQRVKKSGALVSGGAVLFLYDGSRLLGEYDAAGNAIQETVWLGDLPVMVLKTNTHYFVNSDHLGAPRSVAFANGRALWTWDHDPFGVAQPNQNPNGFGNFVYNLRFPGQYYDSETGLHYNMARDYDPILGRYIQSDPIGLAGGVNTYGYVGGRPVGSIDPTGTLQDNGDNIPTITIHPPPRRTGNGGEDSIKSFSEFNQYCFAHDYCYRTIGALELGAATIFRACYNAIEPIGKFVAEEGVSHVLEKLAKGAPLGYIPKGTETVYGQASNITNQSYIPPGPYDPLTIEQNAKNARTFVPYVQEK